MILLELDEAGALDGIRAVVAGRLKRVRAGLDVGYAPGGLTKAPQAKISAYWAPHPGGRLRAVPDLARITEAGALLAAEIDRASTCERSPAGSGRERVRRRSPTPRI